MKNVFRDFVQALTSSYVSYQIKRSPVRDSKDRISFTAVSRTIFELFR